jgi:hypothetical protein
MVADFWRTENGKFLFQYIDNPKYEFPGFDHSHQNYTSDTLWEQISFRIPNSIRAKHPNTPAEELLQLTEGKLITDHFEFLLVE